MSAPDPFASVRTAQDHLVGLKQGIINNVQNVVNYLSNALERQIQLRSMLEGKVHTLEQEKAQKEMQIGALQAQLDERSQRLRNTEEMMERLRNRGLAALQDLGRQAHTAQAGWEQCRAELDVTRQTLMQKEHEITRLTLEMEASQVQAGEGQNGESNMKGLSAEQRRQLEIALKYELDARSKLILEKARVAVEKVAKLQQADKARIKELELEIEKYKSAQLNQSRTSPSTTLNDYMDSLEEASDNITGSVSSSSLPDNPTSEPTPQVTNISTLKTETGTP